MSSSVVDDLVLAKESLELEEALGEGEFGVVHKGTLLVGGTRTTVAVRLLKTFAGTKSDSKTKKQFYETARRTSRLDHPNVLALLGLVTDHENMPKLIMPYRPRGSLLTHIRERNSELSVTRLLDFAVQTADGMAYLAGNGIVHRALAARNCMLDADLQVQVSDYGLARDVYMRNYYRRLHNDGAPPIMWMALESLKAVNYTTQADVWSYGVVLWELMTRGDVPYSGIYCYHIAGFLMVGNRMHQPVHCPDTVYAVMRQCWDADPAARPCFQDIASMLRLASRNTGSATSQPPPPTP